MAKKGRMELALLRALRTLPAQAGDTGIVELAKQYARTLDAPRLLMDVGSGPMADLAVAATLGQLGAGYRMTLVELGLTPKARAAVMKGQPTQASAVSGLDELRSRREKRMAQ